MQVPRMHVWSRRTIHRVHPGTCARCHVSYQTARMQAKRYISWTRRHRSSQRGPDDRSRSEPVSHGQQREADKETSAEPMQATNSQDQPPGDITADLSRQDAPVKEKAQTKHRGRPPEDNADEPGPQPQDRPPDADRAVSRCRATQGIAKWGERCWVCVAHPLL